MIPGEIIEQLPPWFKNDGPDSDCVISTRVRLARNVVDYQFPLKASLLEKKNLFAAITEAVSTIPQCKDFTPLNFSNVEKVQQEFFLENRIVSSDLIVQEGDRGVIFEYGNSMSIMVNEEDHIRMQALCSGCQPEMVWQTLNSLDDQLGQLVHYAYDKKLGFLTTCPTNSGTGFRISFLMHLPGLVLTKSIDSVLAGASQMGMATRGFLGESSDVVGNYFQISNQATMGASEDKFTEDTLAIVKKIVDYERAARERILEDAKVEITDKVFRSYGLLKYARTLTVEEFLNLSSALRFGIECNLFPDMEIELLNRMTLLSLPAHMELYFNKRMDRDAQDIFRADLVKEFLPTI